MGILSGMRVVELAHWIAGPNVGAILGDMGAEVITIEAKGKANPSRGMARIGTADYRIEGRSSLMSESVMRNKASFVVDLDTDEGKELTRRLAGTADVFQTNMRVPAIDGLGLDYESLRKTRNDIVYSRISAYGQSGPMAGEGGFDFMMQGFAGIMMAGGEPNSAMPSPPMQVLVDHSTGLLAAYSIVGALLHRERTGEGQEVHTSLLSTCLNLFFVHGAIALMGREENKHDRLRPGNPLRNYYQCADGRWLICAHNPPERYWTRFMEALGLANRGLTPEVDEAVLVQEIADAFQRKTVDEWVEIATRENLIFAPVNRFKDVFQHDQVHAEGLIDLLELEDGASLKLPAFPSRFSRTPVRPQRGGSPAGRETGPILASLGLSAGSVEDLYARGIVG